MKRYLLILLALAGVLAGCQDVEKGLLNETPEDKRVQPKDSVWTVSIQAEMEGTGTKGLEIVGTEEATTTGLTSIWKTGEKVYVFQETTYIGTLTVTPLDNPKYATLSGLVTTASIQPGTTTLTLLTPRKDFDYTGQVGSLLMRDDPNNQGAANRSIENKYDYAMAGNVLVTAATVNAAGRGSLTTEPARFANQQNIYRLSFGYQKDASSQKYPIEAKRLWITAARGQLVLSQKVGGTPTTGTLDITLDTPTANPFFVALRNVDTADEQIRFRVLDWEGITYSGVRTIEAQYKPNGKFLSLKNTTLNERLELSATDAEVTEVL